MSTDEIRTTLSDAHMSQRGKLDRWVPGPFVVMTLSQHCFDCRDSIPPGATAHRSPDGEVRCAEHAAKGEGCASDG